MKVTAALRLSTYIGFRIERMVKHFPWLQLHLSIKFFEQWQITQLSSSRNFLASTVYDLPSLSKSACLKALAMGFSFWVSNLSLTD